ncbi:MAG TPA: KR domain-containing protein [Afipia sp.]|uniref:SDR family NAD(P)-dependent oxidoreductase n=1 Tax=unclassified Afipia TaxID=2642050 RepID=UPI000466646C|nr:MULTISPECIES: SDR family oxidoreductase [unclassified Afipia]MAH70336.1 3-oxoacyl-ACP reductase [Afipia sp.]OUX60493.1 MAG: 3-oxoacyl-ACP reductase [Afipia sp. TMED4]HAO43186.1 KR domain-containing protein [Afipia sp.]HAP10000.1 KR domain-containing protein [Afipia sp.]HAQ94440.1 KR domain-containing protein [Afipia sp.]|tara:strand:+ start:936 stop:1688 length:753 start_codon:yes stop_codon:yes gene_type:complete
MDMQLKGKVALVTGGARDVGREIALSLAAEGAMVAVNYNGSRSSAEAVVAEIEKSGGKAKAYKADVANFDEVNTMVTSIASDFGGLNIVVNNAGVALRNRFIDSTPEEWQKQINICLYGAIHISKAAAPHLERAGDGRIIALVGDSSRVGESGLAIVAAARAGVIALMKSLAREFGRFGTTANTISLGLIETPHDLEWVNANRDKLTKLYPLRRLGFPSDIAPMVTLLSSKHGGWITGQTVSISGGFSMV